MPRNFRPRIVEPPITNDKYGVGVELEFHEQIPGLSGDTLLLYCNDDTTMEQAVALKNLLASLVEKIAVSNPRK
ncbi:hypothetical protein ACFW16_32630 [Inquilinus sp. NPDC058860]|uniref:hypothetical protein n=1 Tax=Inquilinus sp. NPDC058860 TaxID=3346652 RepID=UPI00369E992C